MIRRCITGGSNLLREISLNGKVFSGQGEGEKFARLPWFKKQLEEKLGFSPYPGTLNIKLSRDSVKLKKLLRKAKPIQICPIEGFCQGVSFKAHLCDLECAIIIPKIADYPADVIEVVAPTNLRKKLRLKDGDVVEVKVTF